MTFYHGTHIQGIDTLMPFAKTNNTIKKSVIYLTPNPHLALFYIWNRPYKWVTFEENTKGQIVYTEWYENQLYDFYNQVSGSIYECNGDNPNIYPTHIEGVYNSEEPIIPDKEVFIHNVYKSIMAQESQGNVIIKKWGALNSEEKAKIFNDTVRAIHMQKLLIPNEDNTEYIEFIKQKFPDAWKHASLMTREEVDNMIQQWRQLRN